MTGHTHDQPASYIPLLGTQALHTGDGRGREVVSVNVIGPGVWVCERALTPRIFSLSTLKV